MTVVSYYTNKQNQLFEIVKTNQSITFQNIYDAENTNTIYVFKIIISLYILGMEETNKYKETKKRCNSKYRLANLDKFREYQYEYYQEHKTDEDYMQKQREKSTRYYETKKNDPVFLQKEKERAKLNYLKKKLAKNETV